MQMADLVSEFGMVGFAQSDLAVKCAILLTIALVLGLDT
jgi:hypothetical protein